MARFTKREIQKFIKAEGISVTAAEQLRLFWAYCLERRRCHGSNPSQHVDCPAGGIVSLVDVDLDTDRGMKRDVRRNVTFVMAATAANEAGLNVSAILQAALKQQLNV